MSKEEENQATSYKVASVEVGGVRGLKGEIELGPGLNLVLGPNNSGKTTLIEALLLNLLVNHSDVRETIGKLLILEASRGSERHAFDSLVPHNEARPCIKTYSDNGLEKSCAFLKKNTRLESKGPMLEGVVEVSIHASKRQCSISFNLYKQHIDVKVGGQDCYNNHITFGLVPSGVLPYNYFDALVGYFKSINPRKLNQIKIQQDNVEYSVDLGADSWNEMMALVVENGSQPIPFYSIGRGFQRALQIMLLTQITNILAIDEIESALHPKLLATIADVISSTAKSIQIIATSQSIEATTYLASTLLPPYTPTASKEELMNRIEKNCSPGSKHPSVLKAPISLIILSKRDNKLRSLNLSNCEALRHLAGTSDPRLTYQLISD